jgi:putative membrane protein
VAHTVDAVDAAGLWRSWSTDWWLWAMLLLSAWLYLRGIANLWRNASAGAGVRRWRVGCFVTGWLALASSTVSPLDALGAQLFVAHMIQHEVMMLVAAPLLVLGRPFAPVIWSLPRRARAVAARSAAALRLRRAVHALGSPVAAWSLHAAVLWAWHAPPLFEASLRNGLLHDVQHLTFFGSALLFWWALLREGRGPGGAAVGLLYLFTTLLHTSVLGALLAFSGRSWYPAYRVTAPSFGLSALEDQQLGGLIMWVPGGLVYLLVGLALLSSLLAASDRQR